jgi:hypothetical protein
MDRLDSTIFLSTDASQFLSHQQVVTNLYMLWPGHHLELLFLEQLDVRKYSYFIASGNIYMFDLLVSKSQPAYILGVDEKKKSLRKAPSAQCLSFNPKQRDFLSVGYTDGITKIYQLNYSLSNIQKDDYKVLNSYLDDKGME